MRALRSLGFRTDLELLRLGGSVVFDRGDHLVVRSPHNPAFWWGNFLVLREVPEGNAAQSWVDRFEAEFPAASHVALGVDATHAGAQDLGWFADHGYSVDASTVLTAQRLSAPRRSVDADCRRLTTDDDWAQSVDLALRSDVPGDPSRRLPFVQAKVRTNRALADAGHGAWFGAFVDGRLVAELGLVRVDDGLARFQTVLTDPAMRRRGYASALLLSAGRFGLDVLRARTLVIVADPAGPAIGLYRAMGFVATETQLQVERQPA